MSIQNEKVAAIAAAAIDAWKEYERTDSCYWARLSCSSSASGVYVVSLSEDPRRNSGLCANAPIDSWSVEQWISRVPTIELNGEPATTERLAKRLSEYWLPDESILYIGKAKKLRSRITDYYRTPLGDSKLHAGGHWIKALSVRTFVYFAEVEDYEEAEVALLHGFVLKVSAKTRELIGEPALPLRIY